MTPSFRELLKPHWEAGKFCCVGLDSKFSKIPQIDLPGVPLAGRRPGETMLAFNKLLIEGMWDGVCAFKPNSAFYEEHGPEGVEALEATCAYLDEVAPGVPIIGDHKRADIGNTNEGYAIPAFNRQGAHAITLNAYLGEEALQPFTAYPGKGLIMLCRTSNAGRADLQDGLRAVDYDTAVRLQIDSALDYFDNGGEGYAHIPLWEYVAHLITKGWNPQTDWGLVVGATGPAELAQVRKIAPRTIILAPGVGAQGAGLAETLAAGLSPRKDNLIVNISRDVIFRSSGPNFVEAAVARLQQYNQEAADYLATVA